MSTKQLTLPEPSRTFDDFCDALDAVVDRWREAETISRAEAVGALEFVKQKILLESFEDE